MRDITELDFSLIQNKVNKNTQNLQYDNESRTFLHLMIDSIFPRCEEDISSIITDGGNDRGADAVYIQEYEDHAQINILQSKYATSIKAAKKNFPGNEIDKLISLLIEIIDKRDGIETYTNKLLYQKIQDIWSIIDLGKQINIKIFFVSNTMPIVNHEKARIESFCKQYTFINFEQISYLNVVSLLSEEKRKKEEGQLRTIDKQIYERSDGDIRGIVANIDASSYIEMISNDDKSSIKRHLFDENIRGFLGLDGGYNNQIMNSALSDENHIFWYMNNGITIIAKEFSHQNIRGTKIQIKDFQIVNGAQTSYSLFEAYKRNPEKVSEIILLVKIFSSSRDDISSAIAIATNSQARIAPRDLKANDHIQKKISSALIDHEIFYERKRNQFDSDHFNQKIDSLKLGQAILAYKIKEPHKSRTASDEIFGTLYNSIFREDLNINYIAKLAKLCLHVSNDRILGLEGLRKALTDVDTDDFVGYSQWHILYCISLLCQEDGIDIPEEHDFDKYLTKAKEVISSIAYKNRNQSYYRIFRSHTTKDLILNELGLGQLNFGF